MHLTNVNLAADIGEEDIHSGDIRNVSSGRDDHNAAYRANLSLWFRQLLSCSVFLEMSFHSTFQASLTFTSEVTRTETHTAVLRFADGFINETNTNESGWG